MGWKVQLGIGNLLAGVFTFHLRRCHAYTKWNTPKPILQKLTLSESMSKRSSKQPELISFGSLKKPPSFLVLILDYSKHLLIM